MPSVIRRVHCSSIESRISNKVWDVAWIQIPFALNRASEREDWLFGLDMGS
jgi:hypothetical protein